MLGRSKLNSIESKITKALKNNETSHEHFMAVINEDKKCRELRESITLMNTQKSDTEKFNLIEDSKTNRH